MEHSGVQVLAIITGVLIIFLLLMMLVVYKRRGKIIRMGWLVNGTVTDILERRGAKNNKNRLSVIEYIHHKMGKTTVQRFSARLPRTYTKGSEVALYYHPDKPQQFVLKNDSTTKVAPIILGVLAALILILGIYGIQFLLYNTYR